MDEDTWLDTFFKDIPPAILEAWGGRDALQAEHEEGLRTKERRRSLLYESASGVRDAVVEVGGFQYVGSKSERVVGQEGAVKRTQLWQLHGTLQTPEATWQLTLTGPYSPHLEDVHP
jgi:hypothetical protein